MWKYHRLFAQSADTLALKTGKFLLSSGVPVVCCGEPMQEIIPGTTDGALEKHVPVIEVEGNKVTVRVGAVEHPMLPEHYIEWIALETVFMLAEGDSVVAAYEYCNLHSLWKA